MRRRALRPAFVVTFALGASAIAGGCGSKSAGNNGSAQCPAEEPAMGTPCDLPSSVTCAYGSLCNGSPSQGAVCQGGQWAPFQGSCNPPGVLPEAGPDVDAAPDVSDAGPDGGDAGPDVLDAGPDGEGHDGGHD